MPEWSDEELAFLKASCQDMSLRQLAHALGRSRASVINKAHKLGLRRKKHLVELTLPIEKRILLTGLIEGEGAIGIQIHKVWKTRNRYLRPYIQVSNHESQILLWTRKTVSFGGIVSHNDGGGEYCITGQEHVYSVLKTIYPHLITDRNRERAELVMEFCERRITLFNQGRGNSPYSPRDIEIFLRLRDLNKKGKGNTRKDLQAMLCRLPISYPVDQQRKLYKEHEWAVSLP